MRSLGLDLGEKRIGVAISDPLAMTAQPLGIIERKNLSSDLQQIKQIIQRYAVKQVVIGFPKNLKGAIGLAAQKVMEFSNLIEKETGLPIVHWDERLTTAAAEKTLIFAQVSREKRKQVIDKLAAVYILQGYLDRQRSEGRRDVV